LSSQRPVGVHSSGFGPYPLFERVHAVLSAVQQGLIHEVVVVLDAERMEGKRGWEGLMERGKTCQRVGEGWTEGGIVGSTDGLTEEE
jgi:hypothetical protein